MNPDETRQLILGRTLSLPYWIFTRGGQTYRVADHTNAFITAAYPDTLILAIPHEGVAYVGIGSIDSIHDEHEAVARAAGHSRP